jgi:hypothetical protein
VKKSNTERHYTMSTPETFQQTFAREIAIMINSAYNCGVLQHHPMTIAGVTVEMTMYGNFNQLAIRFDNRLLSISMYDQDSEDAQFSSIQDLVASLIA